MAHTPEKRFHPQSTSKLWGLAATLINLLTMVAGRSVQWQRYFIRPFAMTQFFAVLIACCLWLCSGSAMALPAPPLSFSNAELARKDFSGQKLQKAEFSNANLESTSFAGADMTGAVLSTSALTNTNLHGTNLTQALIDQVKFNGTDLSDAILVDSIMLRSRFKNVNIQGADFTGALLGKEQVKQLCLQAAGTNPTTGADTRESLGC